MQRLTGWCIVPLLCLYLLPAHAEHGDLPAIALIIDDLGNQRAYGRRVVALPGPVTCAFLPGGAFTADLARAAHDSDKEVMLHLPMQSQTGDAGRDELTLDMTRSQFRQRVAGYLAAVPYVSGLNNHQGSLLTRHPGAMGWLMQSLQGYEGLFFVDSRTTTETVAHRLASEHGIPAISRNVFLDNDPDEQAIRAQFRELVRTAHREGTALAIGHPYASTIAVLGKELHRLDEHGVQLLAVSDLIELQAERLLAWRASSSR